MLLASSLELEVRKFYRFSRKQNRNVFFVSRDVVDMTWGVCLGVWSSSGLEPVGIDHAIDSGQ